MPAVIRLDYELVTTHGTFLLEGDDLAGLDAVDWWTGGLLRAAHRVCGFRSCMEDQSVQIVTEVWAESPDAPADPQEVGWSRFEDQGRALLTASISDSSELRFATLGLAAPVPGLAPVPVWPGPLIIEGYVARVPLEVLRERALDDLPQGLEAWLIRIHPAG